MTVTRGIATNAWPTPETDPERVAILNAADPLLAGTPHRFTGNLSVVQLAVEANLKYWIIVQKPTDLRDHVQRLSAEAKGPAIGPSGNDELETKHRQLRQHCAHLEALVQTYAAVINELARENATLREQQTHATVTPLKRPTSPPQPPDRRTRSSSRPTQHLRQPASRCPIVRPMTSPDFSIAVSGTSEHPMLQIAGDLGHDNGLARTERARSILDDQPRRLSHPPRPGSSDRLREMH